MSGLARGGEREAAAGSHEGAFGLFGLPPRELVDVPGDAMQLSPLVPGSQAIEDMADGSLAAMVVAAPPGTVERRYALAQAIRVLAPGAALTALAPKDKGGSRLARELTMLGATVAEDARRHHRICRARRPVMPVGLAEAIEAGAPRLDPALGLWTQPGLFSWDRIDPGSALLAAHLPPLAGQGADLGCGTGYLARSLLAASAGIESLSLVDLDRRAIGCARRNVEDPRARFTWTDVRSFAADAPGLDFVVMNPPFHDGGAEDRALGLGFIRRAAELLKRGGRLWLVANRHLPYEAEIKRLFPVVRAVADQGGFKIYEAVK